MTFHLIRGVVIGLWLTACAATSTPSPTPTRLLLEPTVTAVSARWAMNARDFRIMLRHIIPNAVFPTLVVAWLDIGTYVITFAALSFLGLGAEQGYADWGQLLSFARNWITTLDQYWYMVFFPGIALVLFVLGWNLVGDAIRDVLDPRLRGTQ